MAFIRGISIVIPGDCLIDTSRWHMLYVVEGGGESVARGGLGGGEGMAVESLLGR